MDPISSGLYKDLNSILDESSKLAESEKISAAEEGNRVTRLQKRIQDLLANEEFQNLCGADLQGSLKKSIAELEGSFHTSASHPIVVRSCNRIRNSVTRILSRSQALTDAKEFWSRLWQGVSGVFSFIKDTTKPDITESKEGMERLSEAVRRGNHGALQQLFYEFNLDRASEMMDGIYIHGTPEVFTVCLQNNSLNLNDPRILECFITSLCNYGQHEDDHKAFKMLVDAGYDPNRRMQSSKHSPARYSLETSYLYPPDRVMFPQALIDWGVQVNPDPSANMSPYFNAFMGDRGPDINRHLVAVEVLLFNGALISPEIEEKLRKDPEGRELVDIRDEALRRLATRMSPAVAKHLKEALSQNEITDALLPLVATYSADLGQISRTPALRTQFLQICREVQVERRYDRIVALKKEFSALMSEYEKLMGHNRTALLAACEKMRKENTLFEPQDESASVTELRKRIESFLKSYRVQAKKFSGSQLVDMYFGARRSGLDPILYYDILDDFDRQVDDVFKERLMLAVSSNNLEDFRRLIASHPFRNVLVEREFFIEVCTQCPTADFVDSLLRTIGIRPFILSDANFVDRLLASLADSLRGRSRSLEETRSVLKLLSRVGFDWNHPSFRHSVSRALELNSNHISGFLQTLIQSGLNVNSDPEGTCPFFSGGFERPKYATLIMNGAILPPEIEKNVPENEMLRDILAIREEALRRLRTMPIASLKHFHALEGTPGELMAISRTPELREQLAQLCQTVFAERWAELNP